MNRQQTSAGQVLRRRLGAGLLLALGLGVVAILSRIAPRSPVTILVLCALAILIMKLVEHGVRRWLARWAERNARQNPRPGPPRA